MSPILTRDSTLKLPDQSCRQTCMTSSSPSTYEENEDGVLIADSTRPQGLLAEGWEFNEECTSVTFTLRQGVKFNHSGNEMTAEDVKWSFRRAALHQDRVGGWFDHAVIGLYDYGDEETIDDVITVIDDYTIRFDFLYPTPFPLHVLSNAGVTVYDSKVLSQEGTDGRSVGQGLPADHRHGHRSLLPGFH